MKKLLIIALLLTSCSDKLYVGAIHVHLYNHNTCEWSCLDLNDTIVSKKEIKQLKKKYELLQN
jgi:hypothetical protein